MKFDDWKNATIEARITRIENRLGLPQDLPAPTPPEPERHKWDKLRHWISSSGRATLSEWIGLPRSDEALPYIADELTRQHREILALRRERDEAAKAEKARISDALERRASHSIAGGNRCAYEMAAALIRADMLDDR